VKPDINRRAAISGLALLPTLESEDELEY